MPAPKNYKREFLIAELQRLANKIGRPPSVKELRHAEGFPPMTAYVQVFGYWTVAKKEAGLTQHLCIKCGADISNKNVRATRCEACIRKLLRQTQNRLRREHKFGLERKPSSGMVERHCLICDRIFFVNRDRLTSGRGKYCCRLCSDKADRMHFKKELSPNEIVELYTQQRMGANKIAVEYGCNEKRIYKILRNSNVQIRDRFEARKGLHWAIRRKDVDDKIIVQYYDAGLSSYQIAEKFGCSEPLILQRLKKLHHPIRNASAALLAFQKTPEGKKWLVQMAIRVKEHMGKPEMRELHRRKIIRQYQSGAFPHQSNTDIERKMGKELIKRGYVVGKDFIQQFNLGDKFACDFCFPTKKLIVECYGDYHHANPKIYAGRELHPIQKKTVGRDKGREAYIRTIDHGSWILLIFWVPKSRKMSWIVWI